MALNDVEHVEAVSIINGILDYAPALPIEIRRGAEGWLKAHKPDQKAYSDAMLAVLNGRDPEGPRNPRDSGQEQSTP